jgi:hypothetical protein
MSIAGIDRYSSWDMLPWIDWLEVLVVGIRYSHCEPCARIVDSPPVCMGRYYRTVLYGGRCRTASLVDISPKYGVWNGLRVAWPAKSES